MAQDGSTQRKPAEPTRSEAVARMRQRIAEDDQARRDSRPLPRYVNIEPFWIGFLATTIPIVATSVIGMLPLTAMRLVGLWVLAVLLEVVGFFAAIVLSAMHVRAASGVWAGLGIGFVALGVTCFAAAL